eukprot:TRINITY_DN10229_c0_g1_i1.p1 TRINITY_DN10229_c0_g1~~TRINITY_DN10229_c0_g1_i1.p1  ORF type:complete len:478 (+),score=132.52 TRINITY_DN10229_c0_g1_i1:47-1435(+)
MVRPEASGLCGRHVGGAKLFVAVLLCHVGLAVTKPPEVWSFDYHGDAIYAWNEALLSGALKAPATLVHIDTHADLAVGPFFETDGSLSSLELAQSVDINDFIQAAVAVGLVDRVIWVKPEWAFEKYPAKRTQRYIGSFHEGKEGAAAFVSKVDGDASHHRKEDLDDVKHWSLEVLPVSAESYNTVIQELKKEAAEEKRSFILDLDLDVFATENFGCQKLRKDGQLSQQEIEQVFACGCHFDNCYFDKADIVEMKGHSVPKGLSKKLADPDLLDEAFTHLCRTPLHYASNKEIEQGKSMFMDFVKSSRASGLAPAVVTVCSSFNGYQPPYSRELTKPIAPEVAAVFGSGAPKEISCTLCAELVITNDLDVAVDVIYAQATDYDVLKVGLKPGESYTGSTYLHHVFFFRTAADGRKNIQYKRLKIEQGLGAELRLPLSKLPWVKALEMVPAPGGSMKLLPRDEL